MIPVYNAEPFIGETIESVLSQTFEDFELLIMDDGSSDRSCEIIQSYMDPRIKYVSCLHNFIKTLNKGLLLADSKYIAFIDHDDRMVPDRLEVQFEFMENHPEIVACGGYYHSFGTDSFETRVPEKHDDIILSMLSYCCIPNTTGFIRKDVISKNNLKYKKGYSFSANYKFWFEIMKVGKLANIPKILTHYRTHNNQASIKYRKKCWQGAYKIKLEILEYFLSRLEKGNKLAEMIDKEFLPVLIEMGEQGVFSYEVFLGFMQELIVGLKKENAISM